ESSPDAENGVTETGNCACIENSVCAELEQTYREQTNRIQADGNGTDANQKDGMQTGRMQADGNGTDVNQTDRMQTGRNQADESFGQIMVCIVINGTSLPESQRLIQSLRAIPGMASITLNINRERTNVIMGRKIKLLWGKEYIEDSIGGIQFRISPLSFYQVNPRQTEKLYRKALEYANLTGKEIVWDIYCGIGTISLFLAQKARAVYGVEVVPDAIRDARQNAQLNHITNAEFFTGKAEEILPEKYEKEGIHADVIVIDPPRKGCEESVLDTMLKMHPERIVYVSCDSATLARDLKYLCAGGYELKRVCTTDMFGNSVHVETIVLLSNRKIKPDSHVRLSLDMEDYYRFADQRK
ncbi:MAG: 23S rRNA (uracil(1939)-C(5))-methyltransferase RlmD, partial [Lachnospiraceae bacterium]|nr:23S rRNA (uracil(1939)-C(5))-methyltransferase RlmD [Lachnospiraceae bacterium]